MFIIYCVAGFITDLATPIDLLQFNTQKGTSMIVALRDLWWLTKSCRPTLILLFIGALIEQISELGTPFTIGLIIDVISSQDKAVIESKVDSLTALFFVTMSCPFVVRYFSRKGVVYFIHSTKGWLVCQAFELLITLPSSFHETRNTGSKTKIIQSGSDKTISLAQDWITQGLPSILQYALSASALLWVWWPAGAITGIGVPLMVTLSAYCYRWGKNAREERHNLYEQSESFLVENVQLVTTVQQFRKEKYLIQKIRDIWKQVIRTGFIEMRSANIGYIIRNSTIVASNTTVAYLGMYAVAFGAISGGTFILSMFIAMRMMTAIWSLGQIIDQTIHDGPSLRRLKELLETKSTVVEKDTAFSLTTCQGSIAFNNVSYRYPGKTNNALSNFSLSIKAGQTVALVGPSGAGKSTVCKLLCRFADPTEGSITLDGRNLRDLTFGFRGKIAVVSQEIDIFSGTIAENIAFGEKDISPKEIHRIAKTARLDEFVCHLPDGYNTLVGERGLKLSGGQRQRLAIARALAADCPIIILDEATSHLDAESELLIQQATKELLGTRTVIIIAHRLSTIRHANVIVVMENGRVVEQGTHNILQAMEDGLYQKHLAIQAT